MFILYSDQYKPQKNKQLDKIATYYKFDLEIA